MYVLVCSFWLRLHFLAFGMDGWLGTGGAKFISCCILSAREPVGFVS